MELQTRLLRPLGVASTSTRCSQALAPALPRCLSISPRSKKAFRCRKLGGKGPLPAFETLPRASASASASPEGTPPPLPSPSSSLSDLPIARVIPQCLGALERGHLVLEAPPGAGKTTALPLELLAADPSWLRGRALVVVEPRRLAAKAAARRMVSLLRASQGGAGGERGEGKEQQLRLGRAGCPIGYAVRGDASCSFRDARVVVVTPGVATRLLLEELELSRAGEEEEEGDSEGDGDGGEGASAPRRRRGGLFAAPIGAFMLDEAHERSAEVDLLFALLAAEAARRRRRPGEEKGGGAGGGDPGRGGGGGIKVVFASATLGGGLAEKAAARLGGGGGGDGGGSAASSTIVRAPAARSFPVAVRFAGPPRDAGGGGARGTRGSGASSLAAAAAAEAVALLEGAGAGSSHARGDVLVFLPGVADIRATRAALLEKRLDPSVEVLELHGGLPPAEQDRVLAPRRSDDRASSSSSSSSPSSARKRRIILSTPVAESSLTVPGVTSVVDSGASRVPRMDANRGVEKLVTLPISRSSADQRAGRAGREASGTCVRLWSEGDHSRRPAAGAPEVSRGGSDLAPLALALVAADNYSSSSSSSSPSSSSGTASVPPRPPPPPPLPWLDEPHRGDLSAALELLQLLGLISKKRKEEESAEAEAEERKTSSSSSPHRAFELTAAGRQASVLGAHPRLSRMLLCAARLRCPELGAVLSAVCSERDFVVRNGRPRQPLGGRSAVPPSAVASPGASAVERVLSLAGRGPLASSVNGRAAAGVLDAAMVLERQLRGVIAAAAESEAEEEGSGEERDEDEEDEESLLDDDDDDDGGGGGDGEALPPNRALRRRERRLALASAAADAVDAGDPTLVGALIASAYPDRVAVRRARGGRDRSAAFVLGGSGSGGGGGGGGGDSAAPATAVLPAGSRDPLIDCPVLAVATLGTSAAAARSSSLIFLAAPLELRSGGGGGGGEGEGGESAAEETLRAIPGLLVTGERKISWIPSAARLVCSVRTRVGSAVVEERALDPSSSEEAVSDDEAGRAFAEAARRGGGLAALREPAESRAWRRLVSEVAAESDEGFSALADLGGEAATPAALEALLPALRKCRTAADLEALEWVPLLSAALLSAEQAEVVEEWAQRQREEEEGAKSSPAPRTEGGGGGARGSPAVKAGKRKGRPKR